MLRRRVKNLQSFITGSELVLCSGRRASGDVRFLLIQIVSTRSSLQQMKVRDAAVLVHRGDIKGRWVPAARAGLNIIQNKGR